MDWKELVVGASCRLITDTEEDEWNSLVIKHKQFTQVQMENGEKWQLITTVPAKLNDDEEWDEDFEIPFWALGKSDGLYAHLGAMNISSRSASISVEFKRLSFDKDGKTNNKVEWR